jgi:hypothetical protein
LYVFAHLFLCDNVHYISFSFLHVRLRWTVGRKKSLIRSLVRCCSYCKPIAFVTTSVVSSCPSSPAHERSCIEAS